MVMVTQLKKEYALALIQDVIWGDMDAFGHINNTVYFRYFEDARMAYFGRVGINEHHKQFGLGPILASAQCNFRLPLDYPDRIHIATRSSILSPKKINMEFVVFSERHGAVSADGAGLIVYYDYEKRKSCEIPAPIVAAIRELEG
jgi:acyl-CoA thioester hydrolase